jgi:NADPH:quinone reductase-like Zn-dependent oxidoreductase
MRAVRIHEHGGIGVLGLDQIDYPVLTPDNVIIKMKAAALNHLDLWVRRGIKGVPLPIIPGSDGSGIVEEIGSDVRNFKVGDRVLIQPLFYCGKCDFCLNGKENYCAKWGIIGEHSDGTLCEYLSINQSNVYRIPRHLDFSQAAAFPLVAQTAYAMLIDRAKIENDEILFIWGGSSGVGSMAIQIAKNAGCIVITTASNQEKTEFCKEMEADFVLDYKSQNIVDEVKSITEGKGVDVVIEHVGKVTWPDSLRILARGGRLVTCGATTGSDVDFDLRHLFSKQQSILGSTMGSKSAFEGALKLLSSKKIFPVVDKIFKVDQISSAHEYLESGKQIGKIIIEME